MRNQSFIASPAVDRLAGFGNLLIAVLAFGMLAGAARADEASPQAARPQAPNALQDVVDAMYNAEYDKALSIVRGWLKAHPGDVQAWNYVAEATLDQEMLKENLYSGSAFLNSGKVFKKRQEPLPPEFEKDLNAALDHA
ncbi:MAG: hypothetical protein ACRD1I_06925, partial [Terriglobia bacterium]